MLNINAMVDDTYKEVGISFLFQKISTISFNFGIIWNIMPNPYTIDNEPKIEATIINSLSAMK